MTPSTTLREQLITHLDLNEIRTLCFYLELDFDEFPRDLGKSGIVERLITHYYKAGKLAELVTQAQTMRPDLLWPNTADLTSLAAALGQPARPRLPFEPEMTLVPAGPFLMGCDPTADIPAAEQPRHTVTLPTFYIGRTPITNEQYSAFIQTTRHRAPQARGTGWLGRKAYQMLDFPVRGISWEDAQAYCTWLAEQTGRPYRLPTEAEWEKAARGPDGRRYPWGDTWLAEACRHEASKPTAVTAHPAGASPYGCLDMLGNVWEWTRSCWGVALGTADYGYPYQPADGRETSPTDPEMRRVLRGGAFDSPAPLLYCARRDRDMVFSDDARYSFRLALDE